MWNRNGNLERYFVTWERGRFVFRLPNSGLRSFDHGYMALLGHDRLVVWTASDIAVTFYYASSRDPRWLGA